MEVLIFLIPLALLLGGLFIAGCVWAIQSGQYDDLETPAQRLLIDDFEKQILPVKAKSEGVNSR